MHRIESNLKSGSTRKIKESEIERKYVVERTEKRIVDYVGRRTTITRISECSPKSDNLTTIGGPWYFW